MEPTTTRPPYDPEVAAALAMMDANGALQSLTLESIDAMRAAQQETYDSIDDFDDLDRVDLTIPGYEGAQLTVSVFRPPGHTGDGPGVLYIHGGGMIGGNRFTGLATVLPWVKEHGAVVVTVDYRLAPEHPDPYPVEDCYAALLWLAEHAGDCGIDADRLLIAGASAGGGLAAGTALLSRDRQGPRLIGQMLQCPMLDDRDQTRSSAQFEGLGVWDRESNCTGWTALLGSRKGTAEVSVYAAPGRSRDLSGLPPTFLDVASAEVFRDEVVAYATQIWADGGVAELHVWPGGTHGWEGLAPQGRMARQAMDARDRWIARLLER
ncbi:alpha/beta hydrolase [Streptomyces sp. NPDC057363]|uniref:alpha/beta hydrolase n=1 Tax=Streptomyces sp. NPDC057363 TaxID=3346107 RepID=UPI00363405B1